MRAERGNLARVRPAGTGRCRPVGRPIVRGAEAPGGTGCPGSECRRPKGSRKASAAGPGLLPDGARITGRIASLMLGPARALTWAGEPLTISRRCARRSSRPAPILSGRPGPGWQATVPELTRHAARLRRLLRQRAAPPPAPRRCAAVYVTARHRVLPGRCARTPPARYARPSRSRRRLSAARSATASGRETGASSISPVPRTTQDILPPPPVLGRGQVVTASVAATGRSLDSRRRSERKCRN